MDKEKSSLLQEWAGILQKKDWESMLKVQETSLIPTDKTCKILLEEFAKKNKINPKNLSSLSALNRYLKLSLNEKQWRHICSNFHLLCRKWIILKNASENDIHDSLKLQEFLVENKLKKEYEKIRNKNKTQIFEDKIDDNYNGLHQFLFWEMELRNPWKKEEEKEQRPIDKIFESLEIFYHENKNRLLTAKINTSKYDNRFRLSKEENKYLSYSEFNILNNNNPSFKYFSSITKMFYNEKEEEFKTIWTRIKDNYPNERLSKQQYKIILHYLCAFCATQINQGYSIYFKYYTDIAIFLDEQDLMTEYGIIPSTRFKNIIKFGLESQRLFPNEKRTEWLSKFKDKYLDKIQNNKEDFYKYIGILEGFCHEDLVRILEKINMIKRLDNNQLHLDFLFLKALVLSRIEDREDDLIKVINTFNQRIYRGSDLAYRDNLSVGINYIKRINTNPPGKKLRYLEGILEEVTQDSFKNKSWVIDLIHYKMDNT